MTLDQLMVNLANIGHLVFFATKWELPILIGSFVGSFAIILFLTHRKSWKNFSERKKWSSRFALSVLTIFFIIPLQLTYVWAYVYMPGRIVPESPFLTATAIKLGAYSLILRHELESKLPAEKKQLVECVWQISYAEAMKYQNTCGDNRACFENIPPMTKETLISKIKESQTKTIPVVSPACKDVNLAKL